MPAAAPPLDVDEAELALSARFLTLAHRAAGQGAGDTVLLGSVIDDLRELGVALVALFLVVPFLQPVPVPGLSTVLGLAVAVVGLQMAGHKPLWLPARLRSRPVSRALVRRIGEAGAKVCQKLERIVRPRGHFFHAHPFMQRLSGGVIVVLALELALPLPIPITNFLPAFGIALLALGRLEEDGLLVVLGYVWALCTTAFFVLLLLLPILGLGELESLWQAS